MKARPLKLSPLFQLTPTIKCCSLCTAKPPFIQKVIFHILWGPSVPSVRYVMHHKVLLFHIHDFKVQISPEAIVKPWKPETYLNDIKFLFHCAISRCFDVGFSWYFSVYLGKR